MVTIAPVLLDLESDIDLGDALKSIKEQIRAIPNRGIGYGLLRYLCKDKETRQKLSQLPQAEVSFNYLGRFDQDFSETLPLKLTPEMNDPSRGLWGTRYLLEVQGGIHQGQLQLAWKYSQNIHLHSTIKELTQHFSEALRSLIAHCQSPISGGFTPSDFPLAGLDKSKLNKLASMLDKIDQSEK
jgi:non-ribosomal peptide synthase protein (TIGR01720 family)